MHQQPRQNNQKDSKAAQPLKESQRPEHKDNNSVGAENGLSDGQAASTEADRAAIDLARVQGYVMRDLELVIGHTIERAVSNATAPLLARIEAQAAQIEQLTIAQRATQEAQEAAQASYAEAQASLAGRIEGQAVAQRLLMDTLQQLRKDRAPETAGIALLNAEVVQFKEATHRSVEEAFTKAVLPYLKQVRKVSQEVHRVEGENERLRTELEAAQRKVQQRRSWWRFW
jgi:hypothetical protein